MSDDRDNLTKIPARPVVEEYAAMGRAYAYAVTLASGVTRRYHDPNDLEDVLVRLASARATDGLLVFSGGVEEEPDDEIAQSTHAGAVLASAVVALGYWSSQDDAAQDAACQAAAALMGAIADAATQGQGSGVRL